VDSGTTDTYLPRTAADAFSRTFRSVTGKSYSSSAMSMSRAEFEALPEITFVFGNGVELPMKWSAYIECSEGGVSRNKIGCVMDLVGPVAHCTSLSISHVWFVELRWRSLF